MIFSEYKEQIEKLKYENERLRNCLTKAEADIESFISLRQDIPDDCTPGSYCKACEFVKTYHFNYYIPAYLAEHRHDYRATGYICGKGSSCKNFIQKEIKND